MSNFEKVVNELKDLDFEFSDENIVALVREAFNFVNWNESRIGLNGDSNEFAYQLRDTNRSLVDDILDLDGRPRFFVYDSEVLVSVDTFEDIEEETGVFNHLLSIHENSDADIIHSLMRCLLIQADLL